MKLKEKLNSFIEKRKEKKAKKTKKVRKGPAKVLRQETDVLKHDVFVGLESRNCESGTFSFRLGISTNALVYNTKRIGSGLAETGKGLLGMVIGRTKAFVIRGSVDKIDKNNIKVDDETITANANT